MEIDHDLTLEECKELLSNNVTNLIKQIGDIKILNGQYGPYIRKGIQNYSIPKELASDDILIELNKKQCEEIINIAKTNKKNNNTQYKNKFKKY